MTCTSMNCSECTSCPTRAAPAKQGETAEPDDECDIPPIGWRCTRKAGHEGPCAAVPRPWEAELVAKSMRRLREQDGWQQYATEREDTAQAVIERHRRELDATLALLAQARAQQPQEPGGIVITRTTNGAIMQIRAVERYRGIGEGGAQQPQEQGEVVVTRNEAGAIVAVTRQDSEGRILKVIAETEQEPRKPLTEDQITAMADASIRYANQQTSVPQLWNVIRNTHFAHAIEAAHGIGEEK